MHIQRANSNKHEELKSNTDYLDKTKSFLGTAFKGIASWFTDKKENPLHDELALFELEAATLAKNAPKNVSSLASQQHMDMAFFHLFEHFLGDLNANFEFFTRQFKKLKPRTD